MAWNKISRDEDTPKLGLDVILCYLNNNKKMYRVAKWSKIDQAYWQQEQVIAWRKLVQYKG